MVTFFVCLVLLIVGFFTYSKLVEKIFRIDDRPTPAVAHPDGVDYVPMKTWRIFLVQLLNIAGLGPIYGALSGACWGPVVYLWIVFGTILGGGVHDFLSGMMSERNDGKSISEVVGLYMGKVITFIMRVFSVVLLVMVGVNFSVGPAGLLAKLTPDMLGTMFWLVVIMVYYLIATFLPIDKIIGKLYPVFGICLIIMALGIGGAIVLTRGSDMPELTAAAFTVVHPDSLPKWSMMFVTVACGAISGFHATQSPMMARCITSEKQGRTIFYGAMVAEGVIALIWAAAGVTFYTNHGSLLDGMTGLTNAIAAGGAGDVVYQISTTLLGPVGGVLAMIGVIACPITSGDTAYRSARLTIADWFHIDQAKVGPRAAPVSAPAGRGRGNRPGPPLGRAVALLLLGQPDPGHDRAVVRKRIPVPQKTLLLAYGPSCNLHVSRILYIHPDCQGRLPAPHILRIPCRNHLRRRLPWHLRVHLRPGQGQKCRSRHSRRGIFRVNGQLDIK